MKKLATIIICIGFLVFGIAGPACSDIFTETVYLDEYLYGNDYTSWQHNVPIELSVPPDVVNSATLEIYASFVDGFSDPVYVEGSYQGILDNQQSSWVWSGGWTLIWEGVEYNIADVFTTWTAGDMLDVEVETSEWNKEWSWWEGWHWEEGMLYLDKSEFSLDYT